MEKKTLGSFLSALRRAQGLTQQEVADRLAVSNRAVSRWERDEAMPDILLLPAIADLFGVTVDELLRGERKREAPPREAVSSVTYTKDGESDSAETPHETAKDTRSEGGCAHETPPSPDPRALRGLRSLTKRAVSSFRISILLAITTALIGFVLFLALSYGKYRPDLGFYSFLIFAIGTATMTVIATMRLRDTLLEQADGDEMHLPTNELTTACHTLAYWSYRTFTVIATLLILALPLVVIRNSHYLNSVLSADSYLPIALALGALCAVLALWFQEPYTRWHLAPWEGLIIPAKGAELRPSQPVRRRLGWMNLVQMGSLILGLGLCIFCNATDFGYQTYVNEYDQVNWVSLACFALGALSCLASPFCFLKNYRHLRENEVLSPTLWAIGKATMVSVAVRNLLLGLTLFLTLGFGLSFGRTSPDGVNWHYYQHWDEQVILIGILVAATIIVGERLLRRHLQKKRP